MLQSELVAYWKQEESAPFIGWDYSYLHGRMSQSDLPWSYEGLAMGFMQGATAVLDMGTGGGERLLTLREAWPPSVTVTEGYPPNIKLAGERLRPLGVQVVGALGKTQAPLPFRTGSFDLVINRHTGYKMAEVERILRPGGVFLTQQVDATWGDDLKRAMGVEVTARPSSFDYALHHLKTETNLVLETAETHTGTLLYQDVGALVYHLKNIPWTVPGFSVETHLPYLLALQTRLEQGQPLQFTTRQYLIQARKPR